MNINNFKTEIQEMEHWWHKLIFLCDRNGQFNTTIPITDQFEKVNTNFILSQGLINIAKNKYPLYVEDIILDTISNKNKVYLLQHIDILFDPTLQIHPIRLLENISKTYKLVVEWPGRYEDNQLFYAEYGHPEYFSCREFEGKVILK
ncbi:BREX-3 system P-loop-containing protein BrxF [Oceanobacillus aidingensis]|uniref:BREX-3 system P-loop-containing protein BrxF n=1 Tax=Oceanobacillus aidingensis TaxID=645964 RepID=A0ABV9JSY4_9BACI